MGPAAPARGLPSPSSAARERAAPANTKRRRAGPLKRLGILRHRGQPVGSGRARLQGSCPNHVKDALGIVAPVEER